MGIPDFLISYTLVNYYGSVNIYGLIISYDLIIFYDFVNLYSPVSVYDFKKIIEVFSLNNSYWFKIKRRVL